MSFICAITYRDIKYTLFEDASLRGCNALREQTGVWVKSSPVEKL